MVESHLRIGCHVSIAGSIDLAFERAKKLGCNTFQIFTKNPRGWSARELTKKEIHLFKEQLKTQEFDPVVAHISYLPNLASLNQEIYNKSIESFKLELEKCVKLNISYFVIHGGSYKGGTFEQGLETYVNSILKGIESSQGKVTILIENSSGGKNSLTGTLENIERIITEISDNSVIQVCFDTCHAFGSGYDLRDNKTVKEALGLIESTIGIETIAVVHANDSQGELGSFRDRHQHIGLGKIGKSGFQALINNKHLKKKPWILETPINELRNDIDNIKYLRSLEK